MSSEVETSLDISEHLLRKINPVRIHALNQRNFLLARPSLQLLFASERVFDFGIMLPIDELVASIIRRESGNLAGLMFAHSAREIICHSDVEHGIQLIGHDINPEIVLARHIQEYLEIPPLRSE